MNLVTDGLPGITLAAEPAEPDSMERPPRAPQESLLAGGLWQHALRVGLLTAALALGTQTLTIRDGESHWQTMTFTVLTLSQLAHLIAIRSERISIFTLGVRGNPALFFAVVAAIGLHMATLYVPAMTRIFHTVPLSWRELAVCVAGRRWCSLRWRARSGCCGVAFTPPAASPHDPISTPTPCASDVNTTSAPSHRAGFA